MTMLRMRPFRGLGATPFSDITAMLTQGDPRASLLQQAPGLPLDTMQALEVSRAAAPVGGAGPGADKCECLVRNVVAYAQEAMGQVMPAAAQAEAMTQCSMDSTVFEGFITQLGVDTKNCDVWWKQPRNLLIGGAVLAAGGLLLWSTR